MNRKLVLTLALTLLVGMLSVAFNVQPVKASGKVYIRADGSIDPPDEPISTVDNATYTLTANIWDYSIVVERDDIEIDGATHTLYGGGTTYPGIVLDSRSNVRIRNMIITGWGDGIRLYSSSNIWVYQNNITANKNHGIFLWPCSNSNISGNNIANNFNGVMLWDSSGNSISGNNITANTVDGIGLTDSSNNSINENNITNSGNGIDLEDSSNNTIGGNNIANSSLGGGIGLWSSENNQILLNNITNNVNYGIGFGNNSSDNKIYHNYFTGNHNSSGAIQQVQKVGSGDPQNTWDNGYPSGGNYWSDYAGADVKSGQNQDLPKGDGLGDSPYNISGNNRDRYPVFLDSDGDGIENIIELNGINSDYDGTVDFRLPGADPLHKDLYLEIDYMGLSGTHNHSLLQMPLTM